MNKEEKTLENLSDRLTYALKKTGMRKADLARAINARPQAIQWLCSSVTSSSKFALDIARVLGINPNWLIKGEGQMFISEDPAHKLQSASKAISIISTEYLTTHDGHLPDAKDAASLAWTVTDMQEKNIYCIPMNDTSMEPLFAEQAKIFFQHDPSYQPEENHSVVVYLPALKITLIRSCTHENSKLVLTPKNTVLFKSIPLDDNVKILGKVIACHFRLP